LQNNLQQLSGRSSELTESRYQLGALIIPLRLTIHASLLASLKNGFIVLPFSESVKASKEMTSKRFESFVPESSLNRTNLGLDDFGGLSWLE